MTNARELWDRRPLDVIWEWGEAEFAGNSKARLTKKKHKLAVIKITKLPHHLRQVLLFTVVVFAKCIKNQNSREKSLSPMDAPI